MLEIRIHKYSFSSWGVARGQFFDGGSPGPIFKPGGGGVRQKNLVSPPLPQGGVVHVWYCGCFGDGAYCDHGE